MTQRTDRIDEQLRQEIGAIIARDIADPRIGFVTITDVETAPDLSHARVWVSVIGAQPERDAALTALGHAMPFIRHELGKRLRLRRIPELHVRADETLERGTRILRLLDEIEAGTDAADLAMGDDALPTPVPRLPREGDAPEPPREGQETAGTGAQRPGRHLRRRRGGGPMPGPARRTSPRRRGGRP